MLSQFVSVNFPLSRTPPNGANPIYQLRILSIVRLNEQLWRSAIFVYFVIRSTVFHLASISESCVAKEELFTGRASILLGETVPSAPLALPKNNSRIRCFHVDMSFGHSVAFQVLYSSIHCVASAQFLPICHCVENTGRYS